MKRWLLVLCIVLVATTFIGASAWEGSAMMSAYGEFPDSGNYGACNSFPMNTAVEVVNLENGKTVTVIITKGSDNPGIFLLLSPEAAHSLDMEPGMVSRVRVSAPRNMTESMSSSAPTMDSDFNPSLLAFKAAESPKPSLQEDTATPDTSEPNVVEEKMELSAKEEPVEEVASPSIIETTAEPQEILPTPDAVELTESPMEKAPEIKEAPIISPEAIVRSNVMPMKEQQITAYLEIPESQEPEASEEDSAVVYGLEKPETLETPIEAELADASLIPDELPEAALLRQAWPVDPAPNAELADCEIRMDELGKPEAFSLAEMPVTEERKPQAALEDPLDVQKETAIALSATPEVSGSENGPESEKIISLEPAEAKPPESAPTVASAVSGKPMDKTSDVPKEQESKLTRITATTVEPGRCYIQIGAYKSSSALDAAVQMLDGSFPVTIETIKKGSSSLYRLFVGPLGRDETGVVLVRVKSFGFKDAFLKK